MRPLPFVWPYWPLFWAVLFWAFFPEFRIVRKAQKPAAQADSPDAGSVQVIIIGGMIAMLIAFPLAWVSALRFSAATTVVAVAAGVLIGGALL